ncbi:MAG: dTDP-glucose 4,6-dehydratase [Coriobacteriia bacterium]|nr:dTDP-glucose 4,6-dehydratase [Coriobacteriia bacterium]
MKMLVTGGAGFIGANFVFYQREHYPDDQIVCVDSLTYAGNIETLRPLLDAENFTFYQDDIADRAAMNRIFAAEKPDVVVNFAAESHVDRSLEDPEVFLRTNIIGTHVLMDAARDYNVTRFHQVSTDEVYGDLPIDRPDLLFTEQTPLCPSSPYSSSKASADLLVMAYYRTFGLPVTISRCSNNYGPYQFPEKLIPLMIARALADETCPVYGAGINIRDWLYVEDHCSAVDAIVRHAETGALYNIGGNNEYRNIDIVKMILTQLGKPEAYIEFVTDRLGHDQRYAIDSSKIKDELGWEPATDFETGLAKTITWYLENKEWWEPLLERC